jgi:predicted  nucleic acid-binding Zn-ribbon protein
MKDKESIIEDTYEVIELLTNTAKLDDAISELEDEIVVTSEIVSKLVHENSKTNIALEDYNKKYEELSNRYDKLKNKHSDLLNERNEKQGKAIRMKSFIKNLSESEDKLNEWNERIWMLLVDGATVHRDSSITFKLYNGIDIKTK